MKNTNLKNKILKFNWIRTFVIILLILSGKQLIERGPSVQEYDLDKYYILEHTIEFESKDFELQDVKYAETIFSNASLTAAHVELDLIAKEYEIQENYIDFNLSRNPYDSMNISFNWNVIGETWFMPSIWAYSDYDPNKDLFTQFDEFFDQSFSFYIDKESPVKTNWDGVLFSISVVILYILIIVFYVIFENYLVEKLKRLRRSENTNE